MKKPRTTCSLCGRSLKSPRSIARGYGAICGGIVERRQAMLDRLKGPPGTALLFPEIDRPATEAAEKEVKS